jgi:hypothetical protein
VWGVPEVPGNGDVLPNNGSRGRYVSNVALPLEKRGESQSIQFRGVGEFPNTLTPFRRRPWRPSVCVWGGGIRTEVCVRQGISQALKDPPGNWGILLVGGCGGSDWGALAQESQC